MIIRTGGPDDIPAVLTLFDRAVAWLAAQGRTGQWGDQPWSTNEARIAHVHDYATKCLMRLAEDADGQLLGVCVLAQEVPAHIPPADAPDLFIRLLGTDRGRKNTGVGAALVADARAEAVRRGLPLLRVDCYAGDDRRLVAAYRALGFTETDPFEVDRPDGSRWPGQVLEIRLDG
ncbi:GNAT family N-acetyltransferase [Kitasatospora viridis]|uniref:Acetyltransferase (GNAT) family protein n=1 Tax=Kitasatospora viridis TaxID=281105 RepID=A0A561UGC7_9ACTN|nr:GNAT family N-acetyltransferase [Kitasatospora viridis]TWF98411.1 acetyltransferase (GNAT) family protein [Kitasatospora viridis]